MIRTITSAVRAHLDEETTRLATIWRICRADGKQLYFTDHDRDTVFAGDMIDEIRISTLKRSDAWIRATYRNLSAPATFLTSGDEEQAGGGGSAPRPPVIVVGRGPLRTLDADDYESSRNAGMNGGR